MSTAIESMSFRSTYLTIRRSEHGVQNMTIDVDYYFHTDNEPRLPEPVSIRSSFVPHNTSTGSREDFIRFDYSLMM